MYVCLPLVLEEVTGFFYKKHVYKKPEAQKKKFKKLLRAVSI